MTKPETAEKCPKCARDGGGSWSQCDGSCPMSGSPHYRRSTAFLFGWFGRTAQWWIGTVGLFFTVTGNDTRSSALWFFGTLIAGTALRIASTLALDGWAAAAAAPRTVLSWCAWLLMGATGEHLLVRTVYKAMALASRPPHWPRASS